MDTLSFLFAAYTVTWSVLFAYLFSLWKKQERIEQGIQRLQQHYSGDSN